MKELKLEIEGKEYCVNIEEFGPDEAKITVNGRSYNVGLKDIGEQIIVEKIIQSNQASSVQQDSAPAPKTAEVQSSSGGSGSAQVLAPLPGAIINVLVKTGDKVSAGQKLMIMEAMKMENDINSGASGTVKAINVKAGDNISEGDVLAVIE